MKQKILFIILFIAILGSSSLANEDDMWNFSKKPRERKGKRDFMAGKVFFLSQIKLYQIVLSEQQGDVCNFTPSCSHYTYKAIKEEGVIKGSLMAIDRLQRCNPWSWNHINRYYRVKRVEDRGYKLYDPP